MDTALYMMIDFINLFILVLLIKHLRKRTAPMPDEVSFKRLMIAVAVTILCDVLTVLLDGRPGGLVNAVINIANVIYFTMTGYIGLQWLKYVDYKIHEDVHGLRSRTRWYAIPAAALMVLAVWSTWSPILFGVSAQNVYYRGEWFLLQVILGFCYIAFSSFLALKDAMTKNIPDKRRERLLLSTFIVLPLLGGIAQAIVYGLPALWTGTTLSILIVYINLQNKLLAMDGLTGVNSRLQMDKYVAGILSENKNGKHLAMLLLDIQDFKRLNDEQGHVMADNMLKTVSGILRKVCDDRNDFVARFGGDEFAVISTGKDEAYLTGLITAIQREVEHYNEISHNPFRLRVGIGRAALGQVEDDDFDGVVSRAVQQIDQSAAING